MHAGSQPRLYPIALDTVHPRAFEMILHQHSILTSSVVQITIVGRVVRVSETATNLDLLIDDGTGTLEAKLYVDAEEEQNV